MLTDTHHIKLVLFDLDGTIYLSGRLIPGAGEFLQKLKNLGIQYGFMTNNSSIGPEDYLQKLIKLQIGADSGNIVTSAEASSLMLREFGIESRIFLLGTMALKKYFAGMGIEHTAANPEAVLVGFDTEMEYDSFRDAVRLIIGGTPYFATHPDILCPSSDGPLPDAGTFLSAIKTATGVKPKDIAGKPNRWIVKLAREKFGVKSNEILLVGDRLETDIKMANKYNMHSALVLSGVTNKIDLKTSKTNPDIVADSIADLIEIF